MARRRLQRKVDNNRPVVVDDFIYNDPEKPADDERETDGVVSDTPEEAVRKLRRRSGPAGADRPSADEEEEKAGSAESETDSETPSSENKPETSKKVYSSGIMLDDNLQPVYDESVRRPRKRHPVLRGIVLVIITVVLLGTVGAYIFHRIIPSAPLLGLPENVIGNVVTPVQDFFAGLTETFTGYFRSMKLRANLENEYNALRAENEQLVYKAMLADELQNTLSQYEDLSDEIAANANMKPIVCTVIGKSDSNYFSTLTINKGTEDGVEDYMAVTISGALVGCVFFSGGRVKAKRSLAAKPGRRKR